VQTLLSETVMSFRADKKIRKFAGYFITIVAAVMFVYSDSAKSQTADSFRDCRDCPEMVEIPKGSFLMGLDIGRDDQKPMHRITINYRIAVGKYEITLRQFEVFLKETNFSPNNGCVVYDLPSFNMNLAKSWADPDFKQNANHPVVCVNWHDAQAYVGWLSAKTGKKYRLLSESEWEYAARAGSVAKYAFGDTIDSKKANYGDEFRRTTPVGSYPGNKFGMHDMHGNAAEWVTDCWADNYEHTPVTGGPMTEGSCQNRVLRGGTWNNQAQYLRSAFRNGYFADFRLSGIWFRVAREL
jgi:formylglycine-generating enzyme required for sulfatase activity